MTDLSETKGVLEAALLVAGEPVPVAQLARLFDPPLLADSVRKLLDELTIDRMEAAGSGGTSELLAWVVVMGAIGERPGHSFGYAVHSDFRCGIGAVSWNVASPVA